MAKMAAVSKQSVAAVDDRPLAHRFADAVKAARLSAAPKPGQGAPADRKPTRSGARIPGVTIKTRADGGRDIFVTRVDGLQRLSGTLTANDHIYVTKRQRLTRDVDVGGARISAAEGYTGALVRQYKDAELSNTTVFSPDETDTTVAETDPTGGGPDPTPSAKPDGGSSSTPTGKPDPDSRPTASPGPDTRPTGSAGPVDKPTGQGGRAITFDSATAWQQWNGKLTADDRVTVTVPQEINSSFNGGGASFTAAGSVLGKEPDKRDSDGAKPLFSVSNGATLSNFRIVDRGADGVHVKGSGRVTQGSFEDIGDEAIVIEGVNGRADVQIDNNFFGSHDDKYIAIHPTAQTFNVTINNNRAVNKIADDGTFVRIGGNFSNKAKDRMVPTMKGTLNMAGNDLDNVRTILRSSVSTYQWNQSGNTYRNTKPNQVERLQR